MAIPLKDSTVGRQVLVFLQTLTEVVRGLPTAAMVYSLQASASEAAGHESLLATLDKLVSRVDAKREPVTGDEVMRVVQRRLFKDLGDPEVHEVTAREYAALFKKFREGGAETERDRRDAEREAEALRQRILISYPFHPDLLDLMYHRWGSIPSYQRTRGALQFLACTVAALKNHAKVALPLIGPGDVPVSDDRVRGTFFSQVGEREHYTSVLESDLTGSRGRAREVDRRMGRESPPLENLRVGTRIATAVFLYSFGARKGEERGVIEEELLASCLAPGLDRIVLAATLSDLNESLLHLHHTARRYRFDTQPNLNKLVSLECAKWKPEEVVERVQEELGTRLDGAKGALLWPTAPENVPDRDFEFKVVYLDLDWAVRDDDAVQTELRRWTENGRGGKREHRNGIAFSIPARHPGDDARNAARTLMGVESLLAQRAKLQLTPEQVDDLKERKKAAETDLDSALRKMYASLRLPIADKSAPSGYRLEVVDIPLRIGPGRDIHGLMVEALRHHVTERVTPQKLLSLCRLGPAEDQGTETEFAACEEVLNWFFSYLDFPKVWDKSAIQRAIAAGVEGSLLGYVPSARLASGTLTVDKPRLVQFGTHLDPSELDLGTGAYVLDPKFVQRLQAPARGIVPPSPPGTLIPSDLPAGVPPSADSVTPAPGENASVYSLRVETEGASVFKALAVLQSLSDKSNRLKVVLEVLAESKEGFDPVWLRNSVEEPLDEAGVKKESRLKK